MTVPQRRRWHYGLRALFVVVTLLCLFLGWLAVQFKWSRDRQEALRWVIDLRARQIAAENGSPMPPRKGSYVQHAGTKAPWSLWILGKTGVERLEVHRDYLSPNGRYSLAELKRLFPEAEVDVVGDNQITE